MWAIFFHERMRVGPCQSVLSCPRETTLERSPVWFRITQVQDYTTGTRAPQVPAGLYGIYYGVRAAPNWQMAKGQAYQAWKSAKKYGREP